MEATACSTGRNSGQFMLYSNGAFQGTVKVIIEARVVHFLALRVLGVGFRV